MSRQVNSLSWFAIHIRTYYRESVHVSLRHKGFEVFAPSYIARRRVAGREKRIPAALFPGYLFCSPDPDHCLPVLTVPGVIRIPGNGIALTPVPADEIDAIRRAVASGLPVEPFDLLQPGEPVQVQTGPLAGIKGEVVYHKGRHRLPIRVMALNQRAVSVEADHTNVARLASFAFKRARVSQSEAIQ